ncbi:MAG TPA: hypothetical protein VJX28_04815, partial [Chthoniobacterales bacterium]|nr:hypothetical protein [Chthoniobacterales bacterium]
MSRTKFFINSPVMVIALLLIASFVGCASYDAQNKESLLVAAGFKTRTPTTAAQVAMFNRMTPYKL